MGLRRFLKLSMSFSIFCCGCHSSRVASTRELHSVLSILFSVLSVFMSALVWTDLQTSSSSLMRSANELGVEDPLDHLSPARNLCSKASNFLSSSSSFSSWILFSVICFLVSARFVRLYLSFSASGICCAFVSMIFCGFDALICSFLSLAPRHKP